MSGKPVFPAREEIHQLGVVAELCGSIDAKTWPEAMTWPGIPKRQTPRKIKPHFRQYLTSWDQKNVDAALDLLDQLLAYNPKLRITASDACDHEYFQCLPRKTKPIL